MMRGISIFIVSGAIAAYGQLLRKTDISPDGSSFAFVGQIGSAGRIKSLVIDPNHDNILYAASEFAGVWKSTTGMRRGSSSPMNWFQSSNGLRNGLTVNQYSLAVDGANSNHLLYASGDDDGRSATTGGAGRLGGLYVSTDAADHWHHEKLCPAHDDGISSVAFSTGRPFVVTECGIWTNKSSELDSSSWTLLTGAPSGLGAGSVVVDGGDKSLFGCSGNQVFYTPDLGTKWEQATINGSCFALTAVPKRASPPILSEALVVHSGGGSQEVSQISFGVSPPAVSSFGFSSVASKGGSGVSAIAAAFLRTPTGPSFTSGPGLTFDIYAADGLNWYGYSPSSPHWRQVSIHVDTWAMVFPSWYDPAKGDCAAYAANDGGVYFNLGFILPVDCASGLWVPVQNGLHALEATQVGGITYGSFNYYSSTGLLPFRPIPVYLPTGDNDVFVMSAFCVPGSCELGTPLWHNLNALGDAGQALVDPTFPDQVLISRNQCYRMVSSVTEMVTGDLIYGGAPCQPSPPGVQFDNGGQSVGTYDLTMVSTTAAELSTHPSHGDYIAVKDFDPWTGNSGCSASKVDKVMRNTSDTVAGWYDLSPHDLFLACDIAKVQAGGGHGAGLVVYVLTTQKSYAHFDKGRGPGKIYRGVVSNQDSGPEILSWKEASGNEDKPLGQADNFYVNPFNPSELYAVDVKNKKIMVSKDSGGTWDEEKTLTDMATNHGEYRIGCNGSRGAGGPSDPFTNVCSIAWIAFDVFVEKIRVAGAAYGGILFSRDSGHHWMALDVTHNNHLVSDNLTDIVGGVFFDGETRLPGVPDTYQMIYAGLKGHSLIRVDGPFLTLEALNFEYHPPAGSVITSISVSVSTQSTPVELRKDADGVYRGTALFDSSGYTAGASTVDYKSIVDDKFVGSSGSHTFTAEDLENGVVTVQL